MAYGQTRCNLGPHHYPKGARTMKHPERTRPAPLEIDHPFIAEPGPDNNPRTRALKEDPWT